MNKKFLLFGLLTILLQTNAFAEKTVQTGGLPTPSIDLVLEEVKLNCLSFKPNLITKFLWKEGPTRELLYKKCLDQNLDDEAFAKYSETMINDNNIGDLSKDLDKSQTRLTIYTLTEALKNYLEDPETSDDKLVFIKNAVEGFKAHYKDKKTMLDVEIKSMKKKENHQNKRTMELLTIIVENEAELDQSIESTLKYMDFILKDRHAYISAHNKFLPKIYIHPEIFKKASLSSYECEFLELNFNGDWKKTKEVLGLTCGKK